MTLDNANSENQNGPDNTTERLLEGYPSKSDSHAIRQLPKSANSAVEALPAYPELAALDKAPAPFGQDTKKNEKEQKAAEDVASRKENAQELASGLAGDTAQGGGGLAVFQRDIFRDAHRMSVEKGKDPANNKTEEDLLMDELRTEIKKLGSQSELKIVPEPNSDGKTVTKSYQLSYQAADGKTKTKTLFVANYDEHGEPIKAADFIASKLADGKITPEEKHLIAVNLRAAYRDNAVGAIPETNLDGAFCLGKLFESKLLDESNAKLPANVGKLTAKETNSFDPRNRVYEFQGQTLAPMDLDPEQRDADAGTAKYYAEQCLKGNLSDNDKIYFNHAIISAHERYGNAGVHEVMKQINAQMAQLGPKPPSEIVPKYPPDKNSIIESKKAAYVLQNQQTRSELCNINWEDKGAIKEAERAYRKLAGIPDPEPKVVPGDPKQDPA